MSRAPLGLGSNKFITENKDLDERTSWTDVGLITSKFNPQPNLGSKVRVGTKYEALPLILFKSVKKDYTG